MQLSLIANGHGTAHDLIYAKGEPDIPSSDPAAFDRMQRNFIIVETKFGRDIGCDDKLTKNIEKYFFPIVTLKKYYGKVEIIH